MSQPPFPQHADDSDADAVATVIVTLCNDRGAGKTICPTEVAKAAAAQTGGDALAWRNVLPRVRAIAVRLAKSGRIVIYRKGKPVDPDDFRGIYRLGLPHQA